MNAPVRRLHVGERVAELGAHPWLLGVLAAPPAADGARTRDAALDAQLELAAQLLAAGADVVDIEGSPGTASDSRVEGREIEQLASVVERIVTELDAIVSVHTGESSVARAAIAAGARIVTQAGGPHGADLAALCAQTGTALAVMPRPAAARKRGREPAPAADGGGERARGVSDALRESLDAARGAGVANERLIADTGLTLARTPAEAVNLLARVECLHALGAPLLLDLSPGELVRASPAAPRHGQLAGTLAALARGLDAGAHMFRVRDVSACRDFLTVRAVLAGELEPGRDLALAEELRYEPSAADR